MSTQVLPRTHFNTEKVIYKYTKIQKKKQSLVDYRIQKYRRLLIVHDL